ncbi:MAG: trimethylamine methyltransferase family protein [Deltaproteobacteria bacterium]|jgi:trimethylamine--corrinoid protein Co-methyltransferase|nr:trimethylamine methyltransferase family protein [Deltaproteobacteria bacterium]
MYDRMPTLTKAQMMKIHNAAMHILSSVGVAFNEEESIDIFKKNGFKVDGKTVFFSEKEVRGALESAPQRFTLAARNPANSVQLGGDDFAFAPGYGAPFIISSEGQKRNATMEDYDNFCKLVQTSKYIDMNGFMMVEPSDIPPQTAHLDMLLSSIILCDKPFMGSPVSKEGARDTIEMAGLVWGGKDKIKDTPVTLSLINPLSPLQFTEEMAGSLIELARYGQACVLASLAMAGAFGPVEIAGVLAMQNAEILAGLTLAQLVRPGVPIIYGSSSSPMDMRTGGLSIGAPELSMIVSCTAQMARFYHLPSRSGGGLTDANFPDAQAGIQSAMALITAARNGINFILHACGILGAYVAMSYEKFIIDEELCGMVKKLIESIEISDATIDLATIEEVGIGGNYLTQPKTFELCRTAFFLPELMTVQDFDGWQSAGGKRADERASGLLNKRLANYEKPDIDPAMESELSKYVTRRKSV